jgi:uncharacterized phage protein (TIGR02218 family)
MSVPVELYRIVIDATTWTWTSGDTALDYGGETYTPIAIKRSNLEQGTEINRANIKLLLPRTNPVAARYLATVPDFPASVTIFRDEGSGVATYWKGRIAGASGSNSEVTLDCESAFTSLRRTGLRARYQIDCRHALYSRGCNLNLDDWGTVAVLEAMTGTVLTIPEAASEPDGWYLGGIVKADNGVMRWVTEHVGDQVTIFLPFDGVEGALANSGYGNNYGNYYGGYGVTMYPGCDRTTETCDSKFSNLLNHGGFPWIPSRNPFDGSSLV